MLSPEERTARLRSTGCCWCTGGADEPLRCKLRLRFCAARSHRPRAESLGGLRLAHASDRLHLIEGRRKKRCALSLRRPREGFAKVPFTPPQKHPSPLRLPTEPHFDPEPTGVLSSCSNQPRPSRPENRTPRRSSLTCGFGRSRFTTLRVRPAHRMSSARLVEEWLLIEWPKGEAEPTKYWLSTCCGNATPDLVFLASFVGSSNATTKN